IEPPKIKAAYAIGLECPSQLDAALQDFILLIKGKIGVELIALGAELRLGGARPVYFEEWARDIGHAQTVFLQNPARFLYFLGIQAEHVFVPHAAQLDPAHTELLGGDFTGPAEVLRNFVVDYGNPERGTHTVNPSFCSR